MSADFSFSGPLGQAIGLALLHALWQGAIVAVALAAILALMARRSSTSRYVTSCAALALVFVMAIATGVRSYEPHRDDVRQSSAVAAAPVPASPDVVIVGPLEASFSWSEVWSRGLELAQSHIPQIVLIWLAGVLLLTLRLAASWTRTRALATRGAVPADANWQRAAARISKALRLRTAVQIVVSGGVEVPSVVGFLKPAILLPVSSLTGLTAEQLEMVLAHELAHIRRHDFLVNAMQSVVETLLFYHPAVWWLSRQIRIERENCCDDLAVAVCGDAISYARALAQLEELRATPALAIAANGGSLIERVRRLVGARTERSLFSTGWTAAAAMVSFLALLAVTAGPILAERAQTPPTPPVPSSSEVTVQAPPAPAAPAAKTPKATEPDVDVEVDTDMDMEMDTEVETPEAPEPAQPPMPPLPPVRAAAPVVAITPRAVPMVRVIAPRAPRAPRPARLFRFADENDESSSSTPPGKLSIDDLIALRIQNVTPQYIDQVRSLFGANVSLRDVIGLRVQNVTADYVEKMRSAGLGEISARDAMNLKVQGVTPDYIATMRSAGVTIRNAREASELRAMNVSPEFVKALAAAGYDHLTARDLARLAASGVNADFVREMSKYKKQ